MSLLYRYPIIARRWRLFELHHHAPTRSPLYLARPCSTLLFPCMDFYSRIWVHPENNNNEHVLASSPTSSNPQQYVSTEYRFLQAYRRVANFFQRLKQFLIDAFFVSLRSTEIVLRCSPFMILVPASIFSPSKALSSYIHRLSWKYGLFTIQQLGPAFIKLFQWAATRRDLFPAYFCDELSQLHDTAYLHTWNQSHLILQREFGKDYASTLRMDDPHSTHSVIGSGSAAQVYRAKIFDPVTEKERLVAVKILHPGVRESMERDLMFMKRIASLLDSLPSDTIKMLSLPRATENFAAILREQLDLRVEAKNLTTFSSNFASMPCCTVAFPQPVSGWISSQVLVEDFVDGAIPIYEFLKDSSPEGIQIRRKLAVPLLRAFLKMVFVDNFVHSDLHAGNILVRINHDSTHTGRIKQSAPRAQDANFTIYLLDAGIATQLTPRGRQNLKDLFKAVILNEGEKAGRLMVERARFERCSLIHGGVDAFSRGVGEIVSDFHDRRKAGLTLGVVRIGALLAKVLDLCRVYGVEIDPAMANIVLSTLILEGLGRSLDENLNLIDCAIPFVLGRV